MHTLTYDTQPPHSRLEREFADGVLKIAAGAEEPGELVRRAALVHSALPAAVICGLVLLVLVGLLGGMYMANRNTMSTALTIALAVAFVVTCAALFALSWRAQYALQIESARKALQQTTLLAASKGRLIIETNGPLGSGSYDLKQESDQQALKLRLGKVDDVRYVLCIEILCPDGSRIRVLPGRDETELRWAARAIDRALRESHV